MVVALREHADAVVEADMVVSPRRCFSRHACRRRYCCLEKLLVFLICPNWPHNRRFLIFESEGRSHLPLNVRLGCRFCSEGASEEFPHLSIVRQLVEAIDAAIVLSNLTG